MKRNEKLKKCLINELKRTSFNTWCDELMQLHEKTFENLKNIFAMRRMQSRNLKLKRRNINRSRKSQNATQNKKLWIYQKNEVVHAKTNESLHHDNNMKKKNPKAQLKKEKRKRKNINTRTYTRTHIIIKMRRSAERKQQSASLKQSH